MAGRSERGWRWARVATWTAVLVLSALILVNTLPYFSFGERFAFLIEKGALVREPLWRAAFYLHVAGGSIALATGPVLLSSALLARATWAHRWLGRAYVFAVLGCAAPAGLYMAWHARGGWPGVLGFGLLGVLWTVSTALGVRHVLRGEIAAHRRWMARSYALALSAVAFRVAHVALHFAGLDADTNYVVSLWWSLVASVVAGEWLARPRRTSSRQSTLEGVRT